MIYFPPDFDVGNDLDSAPDEISPHLSVVLNPVGTDCIVGVTMSDRYTVFTVIAQMTVFSDPMLDSPAEKEANPIAGHPIIPDDGSLRARTWVQT